jgi:hypothetical protein
MPPRPPTKAGISTEPWRRYYNLAVLYKDFGEQTPTSRHRSTYGQAKDFHDVHVQAPIRSTRTRRKSRSR